MPKATTLRDRVREFAIPYHYDFSGPFEEDLFLDFVHSEVERGKGEAIKSFVARLRGDLMTFRGGWGSLQDVISERLAKELSPTPQSSK